MKSAIYIGQEHIEVVGYSGEAGSVKVSHYAYADLPERTMINGNITESSALAEQLTQLKLRYPRLFSDITLVIDSNALSVKEIPVPKLNHKRYLQTVREELNIKPGDDIVFDYDILRKPDGKTALLAISSPLSFLASYLDVFTEAGIKLSAVRVGSESIVAYIKSRKDLRDKTFVINIVDGISMHSVIFSNGQNVFSTRSRLAFDNEMSLIQSIANNYPSLVRFMSSEKLPEIENSYYLGLTDHQLEMLKMHGDNLHGFNLFGHSRRAAAAVTNTCHMSFIGAYNNGINLLDSLKNMKKYMREYKPLSPMWAIPAAGVMIIAALYLVPTLLTRPIQNEIDSINRWLNDPETNAKLNEIDEITNKTTNMIAVIIEMEEALLDGERYDQLSEELLNLLVTTDRNVIVETLRLDEMGIIILNGSSDTETDSARYVAMLSASDLVGDVSYTGYRYDNAERYRFSLQINLPIIESEEE